MSRRAAAGLAGLSCLAVLAFLAAARNGTLPGLGGDAKSAASSAARLADTSEARAVWRSAEGSLEAHVVALARALAEEEHAPGPGLPAELTDLDYDAYRSISFRSEAGLWRGAARFEIQMFHPGSIHDEVVDIYEVDGDSARLIPYRQELFRFDGPAATLRDQVAGRVPGFAGFRVLFPLNREGAMDEVVAFLGASYFRVIGRGQVYGLSSRGLAIDPAVDGPEEFPAFTRFWLERPASDAERMTFHALLESPSVTGAYRFVLTPGDGTEMEVEARLFARRDVRKLGVAPMSSMFLHAPGRGPLVDDFRPRVHDSDGLAMLTGRGEWIWRPLGNGRGLRVTSLRDEAPAGFGLMQRTRGFESYLDLEARYDRRPSEWIDVLGGNWGTGGVELLEIPTESEYNDNIAAYWVPDTPFRRGEERRFHYRIKTLEASHPDQGVARVVRSVVASHDLPGSSEEEGTERRRVVVDFAGDTLRALGPGADVQARLSLLRGEASDVMVQPLPEGEGWRVTFALDPDGDHPADMRLFLQSDGHTVSETWSYVWYPETAG